MWDPVQTGWPESPFQGEACDDPTESRGISGHTEPPAGKQQACSEPWKTRAGQEAPVHWQLGASLVLQAASGDAQLRRSLASPEHCHPSASALSTSRPLFL